MASRNPLLFIFNEVSACVPAATVREGCRRMNELVRAVATMMDGSSATLLNIKGHDIWSAKLADEYTVSDWLSAAESDFRKLLIGLTSKIEDLDDADECLRDRFYESEFALTQVGGGSAAENAEVLGLGAAFIFSGIGLSIGSEDQWKQTQIRLQHRWLDESCKWQEDSVIALNLSEPLQVEPLSRLIQDRIVQKMREVPWTLAQRVRESFPHLAFGLDVAEQLEIFPSTHVQSVMTKLLTLDRACQDWRKNPSKTHPTLPQCHTESPATMKLYGDQRKFRSPDGERVDYKLHCMVGNSYRIHLTVTHNPRGIEIGYIGRHLRTVRGD